MHSLDWHSQMIQRTLLGVATSIMTHPGYFFRHQSKLYIPHVAVSGEWYMQTQSAIIVKEYGKGNTCT